ncbi:hypothetical protein PM8797T_02599 [Gimesia maris DSM 8797]|nr:hypothetical protein PM8797T_02599 [Gimesia maris DSM 8797]
MRIYPVVSKSSLSAENEIISGKGQSFQLIACATLSVFVFSSSND